MNDEKYRIHYVRVTNKGDTDFTDMFDGVPVTIVSKESTNMEPDMAGHLFGYRDGASREEMFKYTAKRQGWNTPAHLVRTKGKTEAERLFDQFDIAQVTYRMVEDTPDLNAPIPADAEVPTEPLKDGELPALPQRPTRRGAA
jgi:hypothetical protein